MNVGCTSLRVYMMKRSATFRPYFHVHAISESRDAYELGVSAMCDMAERLFGISGTKIDPCMGDFTPSLRSAVLSNNPDCRSDPQNVMYFCILILQFSTDPTSLGQQHSNIQT